MRKFVSVSLSVFLLLFFSSCYTYREVTCNEEIVNEHVKYRVTLTTQGVEERKNRVDAVFWHQDSVWVFDNDELMGFPAEEVRVEERNVNWWKTVPVIMLGSAAAIAGTRVMLQGLILFAYSN